MGLIRAELQLKNPKKNALQAMNVSALVDTGSLHLCIPETVSLQLELEELYKRDRYPYVGPIQVSFENRSCFTGALVIGNEVLLGAVPMEDMDILISPAKQMLIVNPESPNIARSIAK